MKKLVLSVVVVGLACLCTGAAFGNIIQVPAEYPTIQAGIDAASSGDTVQVAAGTYYENITMKSGVVIQGAGAGDDPLMHSIIDGGATGSVVTAIDVDSAATLDGFTITNGQKVNGGGMYNFNSSPTVSNCIFYGNSADYGGGMYNNSSSSPTVTNSTFSTNSATLDGGGMLNNFSSPTVTNSTFSANSATRNGGGMYNNSSSPTVTNSTFSTNSAGDGGGVYNNSSSSPTVTNSTFSTNSATYGGGMDNFNSSPTVTSCTFSANSADYGGGMYNYSSSPTVTDCSFSANSADYGGGMQNNFSSSPTVTSCSFSGNLANLNGGGMYNSSSSPTVATCTFSGNLAIGESSYGGGISNFNSSPTVTNCSFYGNSATLGGGGMDNYYLSPTVTNCILWGDTPQAINNRQSSSPVVTYSDIQEGYPGTGNIDADPMFLDPDGPDNIPGNQDDDFHLTPNSPCIDSGDNLAPALPATDFEGDNRKIDDPTVPDTGNGTPPIVDMGADELNASPLVQGDCNEDFTVSSADVTCTIIEIFNPTGKGSADCNGDGSVTSADVTCTILCIFAMCP